MYAYTLSAHCKQRTPSTVLSPKSYTDSTTGDHLYNSSNLPSEKSTSRRRRPVHSPASLSTNPFIRHHNESSGLIVYPRNYFSQQSHAQPSEMTMSRLSSLVTQLTKVHKTQQFATFSRKISRRVFSDWTSSGEDVLGDMQEFENEPKVLLVGYSASGFDVLNVIEKLETDVKPDTDDASSGAIHMMGSIMAFPNACFLWKVKSIEEVTIESLLPALHYRPKLGFLFIGSDRPMDQEAFHRIKTELNEKSNISVEQSSVGDAIGTFNILNGEGRSVAAVLILDEVDNTESTT